VTFRWSEACHSAFVKLKEKLVSADVLAYSDFSEPFTYTDACDFGVGAVLSQIQNGKERVVAYFSTTLSAAEVNYSVTRKELLAVIKSVKHFRHYLYGRKFTLRTDHGSLRWLASFKQPEGQVARWIEFLNTFDMEIVHRPGVKHQNADAMSCYPASCSATYVQGWSVEDIVTAQHSDPTISQILACWLESTDKPPFRKVEHASSAVKTLWAQWEQLVVEGGVMYIIWSSHNEKQDRRLLLTPSSFRSDVLRQAHDALAGGHLGIGKTLEKVRQCYYWVGLKKDVTSWVKGCMECQARKQPVPADRAPMVNVLTGERLERIAIDVMGPLPTTARGNKYIMVVGDYFTKWTEVYEMPDQEARTIANILIRQFICRFGIPKSIHTDRGSNFESKLFREMCRVFEIHKTRTTAYHPQSDGMVERFNRTLESMLSVSVQDDQLDWDLKLPFVMMAYRCSVHWTTSYTPN
jgi:hypothetical protein